MAALRPDDKDGRERWPDTWPSWVWWILVIVEALVLTWGALYR